MQDSLFKGIISEKFKVSVETKDKVLTIFFNGLIDIANAQEVFPPFYQLIHQMVINQGDVVVYLDLKNLNFINSSSLRCMIEWILLIRKLPPEQRYRINFRLSMEYDWQKTSILGVFRLYQDIAEFSF